MGEVRFLKEFVPVSSPKPALAARLRANRHRGTVPNDRTAGFEPRASVFSLGLGQGSGRGTKGFRKRGRRGNQWPLSRKESQSKPPARLSPTIFYKG